ncbi:unnamed protein product, partial [marine sediment metagenome]
LNGDNFIDAADFGILVGEWTVAPLTASFATSLDSSPQNLAASFAVSPAVTSLVTNDITTSTFGQATSDIVLRADGPGLGSFHDLARNERLVTKREVDRFEVALEDAWEGFDALTSEHEDLAGEMVELEKSGHLKRHAQATDDLFASLAEQNGLAGFGRPW